MPQILTPETLHVTKLCCVMYNDATKNELARSSSLLLVNHSPIIINLLRTSFFVPTNLDNLLDSWR